jgi:hypothetical protein
MSSQIVIVDVNVDVDVIVDVDVDVTVDVDVIDDVDVDVNGDETREPATNADRPLSSSPPAAACGSARSG